MALLSREMLHFTGHLLLSRFHCHTEFVMKFSKQSASKIPKCCPNLPYVTYQNKPKSLCFQLKGHKTSWQAFGLNI